MNASKQKRGRLARQYGAAVIEGVRDSNVETTSAEVLKLALGRVDPDQLEFDFVAAFNAEIADPSNSKPLSQSHE